MPSLPYYRNFWRGVQLVHLTDNAPLIALHNKTVITLVIAADLSIN